jgi:hypothetical protein
VETVRLRSHVGNDGVLHLEVPLGVQNADLEVVLVVQPLSVAEAGNNHIASPEWSAAWARIDHARQRYTGQTFSDSAELLREDRQR